MKLMKKLIALAMVAATLLAIAVPAMAAYSTMYVNVGAGQTVRLRATASSSGTVLINIPHGTAVQAEYFNTTWHRVKYNGYSGFMMSQYLTSSSPNPPVQDPWDIRYGSRYYEQSTVSYELFKNVQRDLNTYFERNGLTGYAVYPLGIDGEFGDRTNVAVITFQQREFGRYDRIVGPETKARLYSLTGPH